MTNGKVKGRSARARKPVEDIAAPANASVPHSPGHVPLFGIEEIVKWNQDGFDAILRSGAIVAKGWQDAGLRLMALAQESMDDGVAVGRALAESKSLSDLFALQTDLWQAGVGRFVAEGAKLSEMGTKVAGEAIAPISGKVSALMLRWVNPAA